MLLLIFNTGYSFGGRKFEHALKHGSKNGLFVVTLGWFVDSVKRNGKNQLLFCFMLISCICLIAGEKSSPY